jgi:hypothetical protein
MDTAHPPAERTAPPTPRPQAPPRGARRAYLALAAIFAAGILLQAFLAGAGIFLGGDWMRWHEGIGHLLTSPIPLLPLLLFILSFSARLPGADRWMSGILLFLATAQPVVLYVRGLAPWLSPLHALNALILFALPVLLWYRAWRLTKENL